MAYRAMVKGRMLVLAGAAAAVAAGVGMARTDLLLSRGFDNALDGLRPGLSFDVAVAPAPRNAAADEGFWLTRADVESPAPFAKPLAVGDSITIAGRDGRERRLEVVDLKAVGSNPAPGRAPHSRLLLVTCRVAGEAAAADAPVRFIVEAEAAETVAPAPAKAL
jgi:hypothetical protein